MESPKKANRGSDREKWISWLKDGIIFVDVDEEVVEALIHYLTDLGILQRRGEDSWTLGEIDLEPFSPAWRLEFLKQMETLGQTNKGFAIRFFLATEHHNPVMPDFLQDLQEQIGPPSGAKPLKKSGLAQHKKASDLSTLQIVKKMGRQLSPFLELERRALSHLMGANTSKKDAQKMFHYILGKMKQKVQPREWEQISRRRHK